MKFQLRAIAVAAAMLGHSAMAADYPIYPVSPPLYRAPVRNMLFSWTGCYIGANIGAKYGTPSESVDFAATPFSAAINFPLKDQNVGSFVGGGQVGCNYQIGAVVVGIEGDGQAQKWDMSHGIGVTEFGAFTQLAELEIVSRWQASLRGRIGYAWDRILLYGTAGVSWTNVRLNTIPSPAFFVPLVAPASDTQTLAGVTVGGGVEHAFLASNLSLAVEGMYTWYGHHSFNGGQISISPLFGGPFTAVTTNLKLYTLEGLIKLNYRFGGPIVTAW